MKKIACFFLGLMLLADLGLASAAPTEPTKTILRAVTTFPFDHDAMSDFRDFVKQVNERSKGELTIKHIGGPEALPIMQQFEGVRSGVVEMGCIMGAFYASAVPEANALPLTQLKPWEEIEKGGYDLWVKIHKEKGVYFLGRLNFPNDFYIFTNKRIKNLKEDFKGLKIRTAPMYVPFLKMFGAVPVSIVVPEVYTALERGIVDGYCYPGQSVVEMGWADKTKYVVDIPWYTGNTTILINFNIWNQLPKNLKELLLETNRDINRQWYDKWVKYNENQMQMIRKKGVEFLTNFPPEDVKWYLDTIYSKSWEWVIEKSPTYGPQLRKILSK